MLPHPRLACVHSASPKHQHASRMRAKPFGTTRRTHQPLGRLADPAWGGEGKSQGTAQPTAALQVTRDYPHCLASNIKTVTLNTISLITSSHLTCNAISLGGKNVSNTGRICPRFSNPPLQPSPANSSGLSKAQRTLRCLHPPSAPRVVRSQAGYSSKPPLTTSQTHPCPLTLLAHAHPLLVTLPTSPPICQFVCTPGSDRIVRGSEKAIHPSCPTHQAKVTLIGIELKRG